MDQMGRIEFTLEVPTKVAAAENPTENQAIAPPAPTQVPANLPTRCVLRSVHRGATVFQLSIRDLHYMKIMQEIRHPYILRPEAIVYGPAGGNHTILVKPYLGNLKNYFESISCEELNSLEHIISCVQLVFRQALSGLIYLMDHGLHHANFSLETTYYRKEDKKPVVLLANFKEWALPDFENEKLPEDWKSVGDGLERAVDIINKNFHKEIDQLCFCEIKDLSIRLKDRGIPVEKKKKIASEHFFFWGPEERAAFFTYKIPRLLSDEDFYCKVWASLNTPTGFHWGEETSFYGLLKVMNDHRTTVMKIEKYDADKKAHYLNFVCGSYTHERQLQSSLRKTVDAILRKCDPEFVLNVMKVIRSYEADKQRVGQP